MQCTLAEKSEKPALAHTTHGDLSPAYSPHPPPRVAAPAPVLYAAPDLPHPRPDPASLGFSPATATCPACRAAVVTRTAHRRGAAAFLAALVACAVSYGACFWVPCFVPWFLDVEHFCPRCEYSLGTCSRL